MLQTLLQAVGPHVHIELLLVTLQRGCGRRLWENVSVDELGTLGAGIEALFEVVGCALALKFEGFGLESSVSKVRG